MRRNNIVLVPCLYIDVVIVLFRRDDPLLSIISPVTLVATKIEIKIQVLEIVCHTYGFEECCPPN